MNEPAGLSGVIDSLEEGWALLALDDGQRLDWPRERLPDDAAAGSAFTLYLHPSGELEIQAVKGTWAGMVGVQAYAGATGTRVELEDQFLHWPGIVQLAAGSPVIVQMQVDADETEHRRRNVQNLIDDLFG